MCLFLMLYEACCKSNGTYLLVAQKLAILARHNHHVEFRVLSDFGLMAATGSVALCWYKSSEDRLTALI